MRAVERGVEQGVTGPWFLTLAWARASSLLAWAMANVLDVFSVWAIVQSGGRMAWTRNRPAEAFVIYGLMRLLVTLAAALGLVSAARRWRGAARSVWGALTVCALVTAAAAWWRLYG